MSTVLKARTARLGVDGELWTSQRDPIRRDRIRKVYRKLCETGESGRQLVAVHQEIIAHLDALIGVGICLEPHEVVTVMGNIQASSRTMTRTMTPDDSWFAGPPYS